MRRIAVVQTRTKSAAVTSFMCPKCAMIDRLGKLSCCAPTASWYKNCGRTGDSNFEHTWTEGFKACKYAAKVTLSTTVANNRRIAVVQSQAKAVAVTGYACPKCAVIDRLGELSCCATNASWHKNCGRTGDSNFEHTWTEGFKACKYAERLSLATTTAHRVLINQTSTSQQIYDVQNQIVPSSVASASDSATANSRYCDQISHIMTYTGLLMLVS